VSPTRIAPLVLPSDGLLARLDLIDGAERTLDAQYYLWDSDAIGYVILNRLIAAADRGVRVRLLVDDMKLRSRTRSIASLCLHPNLEIRLFNPWTERSSAVAQGLEFVRRFAQLDRRMHNKLMVADRDRAVFGGRNLAAEHFGLGDVFNLVDFDLLVEGTEVVAFSDVFETYWETPVSVPGSRFSPSVSEEDLSATRAMVAGELRKRRSKLSAVLASSDGWEDRKRRLTNEVGDGRISVTADPPAGPPIRVIAALQGVVDSADDEIVVITPFFVPSEVDVAWYARLVDRGVRIRLLTNSLASNQGTISNSGLKKERRALVEAGVELFELRTDAAAKSEWELPPQVAQYLGLHAKIYSIDRDQVFVGSVNLDPRSKRINTEMGALIHSPELAAETADAIARLMTPANAWRVDIAADGQLVWRSDEAVLNRQPARNGGQRLADFVFGLLPVRDQI
jgi:putative cardiolipin synthase